VKRGEAPLQYKLPFPLPKGKGIKGMGLYNMSGGEEKMAKLKKTWREKLADSRDMPRVIEITENMSQRWGTGTCVIPAPMEVDELMRHVPEGRLITINQIREALAKRHGATIG